MLLSWMLALVAYALAGIKLRLLAAVCGLDELFNEDIERVAPGNGLTII